MRTAANEGASRHYCNHVQWLAQLVFAVQRRWPQSPWTRLYQWSSAFCDSGATLIVKHMSSKYEQLRNIGRSSLRSTERLRKNTPTWKWWLLRSGRIFDTNFFLLIQHTFIHKSAWLCSIYLSFVEVLPHRIQCFIFPDRQLNVSNFARISYAEKQMQRCCMSLIKNDRGQK